MYSFLYLGNKGSNSAKKNQRKDKKITKKNKEKQRKNKEKQQRRKQRRNKEDINDKTRKMLLKYLYSLSY